MVNCGETIGMGEGSLIKQNRRARSMMQRWLLVALAAVILHGCAGPELKPPAVGLMPVPASEMPRFRDDLEPNSLKVAAEQSLPYYRSLPPLQSFRFGQDQYTVAEMAMSMERLIALIDTSGSSEVLAEAISREFVVYRAVGSDGRGTVQMSAYYEHTLEASLTPTDEYRYPIYGRPSDLVTVDLGLFGAVWQGQKIVGRLQGWMLVPYYTRKEIDADGVLAGDRLEIAWAKDPVDIFLLQIEGSGWLRVPGREQLLRIRFDGTNGRAYRSVGKHLVERGLIAEGALSYDAVTEYLRTHPDERAELLNHNERYVFFQLDDGPERERVFGYQRMTLTPWRSIAIDATVFPPGSLGWIESDGRGRVARFVLAQDEGAAIKGPGRLDLFVGARAEAERFAADFWETGRLYFLVKRR